MRSSSSSSSSSLLGGCVRRAALVVSACAQLSVSLALRALRRRSRRSVLLLLLVAAALSLGCFLVALGPLTNRRALAGEPGAVPQSGAGVQQQQQQQQEEWERTPWRAAELFMRVDLLPPIVREPLAALVARVVPKALWTPEPLHDSIPANVTLVTVARVGEPIHGPMLGDMYQAERHDDELTSAMRLVWSARALLPAYRITVVCKQCDEARVRMLQRIENVEVLTLPSLGSAVPPLEVGTATAIVLPANAMVRDPRAVTDVALRAIEHGAATSALLHACHDGGAAPLLLSDVLVPAGDADDGDNAGRAVCVARVRAHDVGELAARAVSASRDSLPRDVPAPASAPLFAPSSQRDDVTRAVAVRVDGEPAPPYPTPVAKASAAPRRVCFGVPSRTADRFGQVLFPRVTDLSLFRVFLRSLLHYSRADLEAGAFDFVVLLGYDAGDPVYDEPALMRRVRARWADEAHGAPLRLRTVRFGSEYRSRVVWIWNELFHLAQHERCDLFFQTNDDAGIAFSGWAQRYHDALMGFERAPGFGVVGPVEHDTGTVLHDTITQAVVHAPTHFDVFGTFYPWTFLNWYSDNWLTEVYAEVPGAVHRSRDDIVHNSRPQGSARYHIARQGHLLMVELHKGKRRAADYVAARERVQGR